MTEYCIDCDTPLDDEDDERCMTCNMIEEGIMCPCPRCENAVHVEELTTHGLDDFCDSCREADREAEAERLERVAYYARLT